MMGNPWVMIGLGGFVGAVARYSVTMWSAKRFPSLFPYGTLFVNLLGSFLLGWIMGAGQGQTWIDYLGGIGFMGAFTTFSTLTFESLQLAVRKEWAPLLLYVGISYTFGILLAFAGYAIGGS